MTTYFTSDEHYSHKNIIEYCKRPFGDVEEMNEAMVKAHNTVVSPEDIVWHLGDFSLHEKYVDQYLPRLNGTHRLVAGNHDACHPCKKNKSAVDGYLRSFEKVYLAGLEYGGCFLHHMPPSTDTEDLRHQEYRPVVPEGTILLHGHVHERWKVRELGGVICVNVGVDVWDYKPVTLEQLSSAVREFRGVGFKVRGDEN